MDARKEQPAELIDNPVLATPAKEDKGVDAQVGFGFQYDCIAKLAIRMLTDESVVAIVCERHEDCVLIFANGEAELVSCKARSASLPYSIDALLEAGGLLHLFDRWD